MKRIDLGQTLGIVANLSVIAGIVFLGFELNQNQVIGRAQVRNEIARAEHELTIFDVENNMLDFLQRMASGDSSEDVQNAIRMRSALWLRHYQNVHYQFRVGLFDESEFIPIMNGLIQQLDSQEMMRSNFCTRFDVLSPVFAADVNSRLSRPCE